MRKNKINCWPRYIMLTLGFVIFGKTASAQNLDIRAYKTRLSDVMNMIGEKSKKKIRLVTDQNPLISIGSKDSNLNDTLRKIENLYGFQFEVAKDEIIVKEKPTAKGKNGRGLASVDDDGTAGPPEKQTPTEERTNGFRYRTVAVNGTDVGKIAAKIKTIIGEQAKYLEADETNKKIVMYGDEQTFRLVRQIVDDLDEAPPQILLGAKVIEATNSFARDVGVQLSRNAGTGHGIFSANTDNPSASAHGAIQYNLGIIDAIGIDATLEAGESTGVAKVISSPQVVTTDNVAASLNSGLTFSVRTAQAATGSTGGSAGVLAGNLEKVTAGLVLEVTPKVLRDGKIRLKINISSSAVDKGSSVDGIPGISDTAVKTEMIVHQGQTAAIGGLYKHSNDNSDGGVPYLNNIPIFGFLFNNNSKSKVKQEIMAFITPTIIANNNERSINFDAIKVEADHPLVKTTEQNITRTLASPGPAR